MAPESRRFAVSEIVVVQSLGLLMMLNLGAIGESLIFHASISNPKKLKVSLVISLSQSRVARCSSVNFGEIHTIVTVT